MDLGSELRKKPMMNIIHMMKHNDNDNGIFGRLLRIYFLPLIRNDNYQFVMPMIRGMHSAGKMILRFSTIQQKQLLGLSLRELTFVLDGWSVLTDFF